MDTNPTFIPDRLYLGQSSPICLSHAIECIIPHTKAYIILYLFPLKQALPKVGGLGRYKQNRFIIAMAHTLQHTNRMCAAIMMDYTFCEPFS